MLSMLRWMFENEVKTVPSKQSFGSADWLSDLHAHTQRQQPLGREPRCIKAVLVSHNISTSTPTLKYLHARYRIRRL